MKPRATSTPSPDNFPKTAADWQRVIDAAPGVNRLLTAQEAAHMQRSVVARAGGPQAVREALAARLVPAPLDKRPATDAFTQAWALGGADLPDDLDSLLNAQPLPRRKM